MSQQHDTPIFQHNLNDIYLQYVKQAGDIDSANLLVCFYIYEKNRSLPCISEMVRRRVKRCIVLYPMTNFDTVIWLVKNQGILECITVIDHVLFVYVCKLDNQLRYRYRTVGYRSRVICISIVCLVCSGEFINDCSVFSWFKLIMKRFSHFFHTMKCGNYYCNYYWSTTRQDLQICTFEVLG